MNKQFPMYLMVVDGNQKFYPFCEAYKICNDYFAAVSFGKTVIINDKFEAREMTKEDRQAIYDAAEEYDAEK